MHFWRLCSRLVVIPLLFCGAALAQQTGLIVSPSDLSLAVQTGSTTPATAIIAIATPARSVPFSVTVRHLGGSAQWLTVRGPNGEDLLQMNPAGTTPANVTASADGSRLAPGTYLAQVAVSAGGLGRVVNVALSVGGTGGAVFGVSPSSLTFISTPGATTVAE